MYGLPVYFISLCQPKYVSNVIFLRLSPLIKKVTHNIIAQHSQVNVYIVERNGSGVELQTLDFRREPRFESFAAVLKPWASFFTLHCSSSLSGINEYLAIDSGGYV